MKVCFDEILYLEAAGTYVSFVLKDKSVLSRMTFTEVETVLPSEKFLRIHRSFLVAISQINKIEKHQVTIANLVVPVSEAYLQDLLRLSVNK